MADSIFKQIGSVIKHAIVGKQTIYIPACAMIPRKTNGANQNSIETSNYKIMLSSMDFDSSLNEFVQFSVQMPKGWDASNVTAQFIWSCESDSGTVTWAIQGIAYSDNTMLDNDFGTEVLTTDISSASNTVYISPESNNITISNTPSKSDWVIFQVYRDVSNDTLSVDARLHGISLLYITEEATDA